MSRSYPIVPALLLACAAMLLPLSASAQSLRGSKGSVDRMYYHAVDHGMYFYKTSGGLRKAAGEGRFVRLSTNANFRVEGVSYPFVQEAARLFLDRLGKQYRQACGERLVVTSAARPRSMRLANSVDKSVHPTGMAMDLRKPARSSCRTWLRNTLLALEGEGVVEATEEYTPPHFHVAVFPTPYTRYVSRMDGAPSYAVNSPSTGYRVRSGDSLWGIARQYSTNVESLKSINGLRSSSLKIGQILVIPRYVSRCSLHHPLPLARQLREEGGPVVLRVGHDAGRARGRGRGEAAVADHEGIVGQPAHLPHPDALGRAVLRQRGGIGTPRLEAHLESRLEVTVVAGKGVREADRVVDAQ
jgi:hypothetical protein